MHSTLNSFLRSEGVWYDTDEIVVHKKLKEMLGKLFLIPTQAKRNLSSRSGIGGVLSAT